MSLSGDGFIATGGTGKTDVQAAANMMSARDLATTGNERSFVADCSRNL